MSVKDEIADLREQVNALRQRILHEAPDSFARSSVTGHMALAGGSLYEAIVAVERGEFLDALRQ